MPTQDNPSQRHAKRLNEFTVYPVERGFFADPDDPDREAKDRVGIRRISAHRSSEALAFASNYAKSINDKAGEGDTCFDYAHRAAIVAFCCVHADSSKEDPKPLFSSPSEVIESYDEDSILYLYTMCRTHSDMHSVITSQLDPNTFALTVGGILSPDLHKSVAAYSKLRPGAAYQFCKTLCALWQQEELAAVERVAPSVSPEILS